MALRPAISTAYASRMLLLLVAWTLSGCGTLSSIHEIVSVTTPADPVLVKLDDDPNFFSPDFIRMHRGRSHEVELLDAKTKLTLAKGTVQCQPRWITSGLCNGLLTLVGFPLGVFAFGLDLLDGAAFDCRGVLPLPQITERVPKPRPRLCPTYLIAPPGHADFAISARLVNVWQNSKRREPGFCGRFVDDETTDRVFNYLNISNLNAATFAALNRSQANILGFESKADHLVILRDELRRGAPKIEAEIIDLHTLERHHDPLIAVDRQLAETLVRTERNFWLMYSFSLVPNTVMYGVSNSVRELQDADTGHPVTSAHEHGLLPRAVTSLAVGSLDHPMGFDEWDASLRFYPSLDLNFWSVDVRTESRPDKVRYRAVFAHLPYNAELSLYTPAGTFGFAVGAGPLPTWTFRDKPTPQLLWAATTEISWTAFTSRDIFLQLAYDYKKANAPIEANGVKTSEWTETSARIGYFTDVFSRMVQSVTTPRPARDGSGA